MSRIGRKPITVPKDVKVKTSGLDVMVEGPKGKLSLTISPNITLKEEEGQLILTRARETSDDRAKHGLYRALISNMVDGVVKGFSKELEVVGVGYRASMKGKELSLSVGFSHTVELAVPDGLSVKVPKPTTILIEGVDKQQVGQFAANVRSVKPPEPYKGKGIKYVGESIRRKAGKAATGSKGG